MAAEAASQLGLTALALPAELLPQHADDLENLARICTRESLLLPLALYLDADEALATPAEGLAAPVARFAGRTGPACCSRAASRGPASTARPSASMWLPRPRTSAARSG